LNNENLEFYFSVELYRTLPPQARALKAAEMLRHFVREGATSQINIDHSVRSDLEAALPQSLLELVEKITADAKSKAAGGESSTSVSASGGGGGDESVAASGKKKTKTKSKSSSTPADDAASLNVASDIFDVAQARVYELMERDLWTRFRVDQATSSPRNNKAKTKKPAAAAATGMNASASAVGTSTPSTPSSSSGLSSSGTPSTGAKPLSPRRKAGNTVSSVAATMQAPAMVTQIKRVNGKIVVFRKGE
jgi:hypothetical protein